MFIISRCLLGCHCKYNGGHNRSERVLDFASCHSCLSVCPETRAELPSPRPPAEHQQGERLRILDREGKDLTEDFVRGAELSYRDVLEEAAKRGEVVEGAILKANSPSCGAGMIYDGTFSGTKIPGNGVFAEMLIKAGIPVRTEKDEAFDFPPAASEKPDETK